MWAIHLDSDEAGARSNGRTSFRGTGIRWDGAPLPANAGRVSGQESDEALLRYAAMLVGLIPGLESRGVNSEGRP
jgi:hypothetical protein